MIMLQKKGFSGRKVDKIREKKKNIKQFSLRACESSLLCQDQHQSTQ
jgi:hypothetical protein